MLKTHKIHIETEELTEKNISRLHGDKIESRTKGK